MFGYEKELTEEEKIQRTKEREEENKKWKHKQKHCWFCDKPASPEYDITTHLSTERTRACSHCSALIKELLLQESRFAVIQAKK